MNPRHDHSKMEFLINRINEINEWRREAVLHAETQEAVQRIDRRVFELREAVEKNLNR
jgi:hypothetical protein